MMFASQPSQEVNAAVGETTTCKIDITEKNSSTTSTAIAAGIVAMVHGTTAAMQVGTLLHVPSTGEDILVTAIVDGTNTKVLRAQNGTTAMAIAAAAMVTFKTANAGSASPKTCMGSTSADTTVTVTSATSGQKARVHVDHVTHSGVVTTTTAAEAIDLTETVITTTASAAAAGIVADDVIAIGDEVMTVTSVSGSDLTVVRGAYGTTAVAQATGLTVYELTASFAAANFGDANQVMPKLNALAGRNQVSEAIDVNLDTFTAATATKAAFYSGTFTVSSTTAGESVIAVRSANVGPVYGANPDVSTNLVHVQFRAAPIDYTDTNGNGAYNSGTDFLRTTITAQSDVSTATTSAAVFEIADTKGQQLVGTATLTLDDAACAAGVVWSGSGTCSVTHTTSATAGESVAIKGLPATGNFRYTWTGTYSGASGTIDLATVTNKANNYVWRSNNVTSSLTAGLFYNATAGATTASTAKTVIPAVTAGTADNYYIKVTATDSAGNPVADTIKVKDLDGDGTDGLGSDVTFEVHDGVAAGATVTSIQTASGVAYFGVKSATINTASATDPITGTYDLQFYRSADTTISVDITLPVKSVASTFSIADSSGQNDDGSLTVGGVGTYVVSAVDANGNQISADLAAADVTFVVTGLGTGATAGKSIPSTGTLGIDDVKGGTISIVAPTVAGNGTLAVIYGGKIVASKVITFASTVVTGTATVSGTGCTGDSTGSYTCVVTEGGTAAEVATASGAVSVWQSDADGVLQGYVVGTPDFVNTGMASTDAIADNSAVIVVR
jgi:hypothetical protein